MVWTRPPGEPRPQAPSQVEGQLRAWWLELGWALSRSSSEDRRAVAEDAPSRPRTRTPRPALRGAGR